MLIRLFSNQSMGTVRYLLCIDYDDTLVHGNAYLKFQEANITPGNALYEDVSRLIGSYGLKYPHYMSNIIRYTLRTNNHVAIVSFTRYSEIVKPTLSLMGLRSEEISQIYIKSCFPTADWKEVGKKLHIESAMNYFSVNHKNRVCLIDDNVSNVRLAKEDGCHAVLVPKSQVDECVTEQEIKKVIPEYIESITDKLAELSLSEQGSLFSNTPIRSYLPHFGSTVSRLEPATRVIEAEEHHCKPNKH